ncbi:serine hydrolase domain-containing protein [Candidatus Phycosocius spiralis]|uniref:Beta-lactamase-related domain-containing protein n=1 Tax=Candidatus Phycosocius spiralis TaxID=2815099 RepID=A0ABQ4PUI0_9PROT|nr:serine hydrolase domain-containing protein [Candidatus Phycosocius spiralis]GIU66590.1 hypothetical protein PsB1_0744 [Candidatus Phycosocius spiralis]
MWHLGEVLGACIDRLDVPGGTAILFQGQDIIWSGAFGVRKIPDTPMEVSSKARVASISKVVTALTYIQLVQSGHVTLDGDISDHLGFVLRHPKFNHRPITARMILSHTSGIRDGENYRGVVGETLESFFVPTGEQWHEGAHWADVDKPLGFFTYSNLAMGLLAQVCEGATGERFDRLAAQLVLHPLGLDCGFNWSGVSERAVQNGVTLYRRYPSGAWESQIDQDLDPAKLPLIAAKPGQSLEGYRIGTNGLLFSPQGGLRASVEDIAKIGMALTGAKALLSPDVRALITTPHWTFDARLANGDTSGGAFQGFGLGVHRLIPGHACPITGLKCEMIGHYGEAYGLLGGIWVDPKSSKGFAWFVNGGLYEPEPGRISGLYLIEEEVMQAAAVDLGLVAA